MDRTEGRLSLAVLAAGAALVLVAGSAWWVSAAPAAAPTPAQTTPLIVVPEPVVTEPAPNGPESYLPEFDNTVERQVGQLGPDESYTLEIASTRDSQYWLQYVCVGPGDLSIRIRGTSEGEQLHQMDCEGNFSAFHFTAAGSSVLVEVHRPGPEPAEVGVQIISRD